MPGGVYRVGMPRTDLHVTLDGVELKPTLALGSWLAFESTGKTAMVYAAARGFPAIISAPPSPVKVSCAS